MIILLISPQKLPIKLPPGQEPTTSTHGSSVHPLNYPSVQKKNLLTPQSKYTQKKRQKKNNTLYFPHIFLPSNRPLVSKKKKIPLNKKKIPPFFSPPF
jgi:hypothetical protein